jgi:hypothetical protein
MTLMGALPRPTLPKGRDSFMPGIHPIALAFK